MIRAYWRHAPLFLKITTMTAVALVALQIVLLVISRGSLFVALRGLVHLSRVVARRGRVRQA
jgi:hypothetical protein